MRAAIYLRVSKSDGSQSVDNQRPEIEQVARARGFQVGTIYEETVSAAKVRPQYDQMMKDAKRGKFDVLIVWALMIPLRVGRWRWSPRRTGKMSPSCSPPT